MNQDDPIGHGYALRQLERLQRTAATHAQASTREQARQNASRWRHFLANLATGKLIPGSRTPLRGIPVWATPEVIHGGFATGNLAAEGPLLPHEREILATLPGIEPGNQRLTLNLWHLQAEGFVELSRRLHSGAYAISFPEEGALLALAWLLEKGDSDTAEQLAEKIAPLFPRLRFYPETAEAQAPETDRFGLETVARIRARLRETQPSYPLLLQRRALEVWLPFHDEVVGLFLETSVDGQVMRQFPSDWTTRAGSVLDRFEAQARRTPPPRKAIHPGSHARRLRDLLRAALPSPTDLAPDLVRNIQGILDGYLAKRGAPGSADHLRSRQRQGQALASAPHERIAKVVAARLDSLPGERGLDHPETFLEPLTAEEAETGLDAGTVLPERVAMLLERTRTLPLSELVERRLVTSPDQIAKFLPDLSAHAQASRFADPEASRLQAALYRAFRRRRSLLLLDLQSQVRFKELPWVEAMERHGQASEATQSLAADLLVQACELSLEHFPHRLVPNKMLQELRMLAQQADWEIPLVDELAADIFTGQFSDKFWQATQAAGRLLEGTLYERYYGLDYAALRQEAADLPPLDPGQKATRTSPEAAYLARICHRRAGVEYARGSTGENGRVIEQQQILTTQNLASLLGVPAIRQRLAPHFPTMARRCFQWIGQQFRSSQNPFKPRLKTRKNTAYAWRQMVVYLALQEPGHREEFLRWALSALQTFPARSRSELEPLLAGLAGSMDASNPVKPGSPYLGWISQGSNP